MEGLVKKYQQRFRKVRDLMEEWETVQSRLLSQFRNVSSIIQILKTTQDSKNYGTLASVDGIVEAVMRKQMLSLHTLLFSLNKTLEEFGGLVFAMEKICRDGRQLVKGVGGSNQLTAKQLRQRVGIKPCLADCLDGLMLLHDMHQAEYLFKSSVVSALSALALKPSCNDLGALQQLLIDQPNIPKEEDAQSSAKMDALNPTSKSLIFQNMYLIIYQKRGWKFQSISPNEEYFMLHDHTFQTRLPGKIQNFRTLILPDGSRLCQCILANKNTVFLSPYCPTCVLVG